MSNRHVRIGLTEAAVSSDGDHELGFELGLVKAGEGLPCMVGLELSGCVVPANINHIIIELVCKAFPYNDMRKPVVEKVICNSQICTGNKYRKLKRTFNF